MFKDLKHPEFGWAFSRNNADDHGRCHAIGLCFLVQSHKQLCRSNSRFHWERSWNSTIDSGNSRIFGIFSNLLSDFCARADICGSVTTTTWCWSRSYWIFPRLLGGFMRTTIYNVRSDFITTKQWRNPLRFNGYRKLALHQSWEKSSQLHPLANFLHLV